jgi:hypothetical protein
MRVHSSTLLVILILISMEELFGPAVIRVTLQSSKSLLSATPAHVSAEVEIGPTASISEKPVQRERQTQSAPAFDSSPPIQHIPPERRKAAIEVSMIAHSLVRLFIYLCIYLFIYLFYLFIYLII